MAIHVDEFDDKNMIGAILVMRGFVVLFLLVLVVLCSKCCPSNVNDPNYFKLALIIILVHAICAVCLFKAKSRCIWLMRLPLASLESSQQNRRLSAQLNELSPMHRCSIVCVRVCLCSVQDVYELVSENEQPTSLPAPLSAR